MRRACRQPLNAAEKSSDLSSPLEPVAPAIHRHTQEEGKISDTKEDDEPDTTQKPEWQEDNRDEQHSKPEMLPLEQSWIAGQSRAIANSDHPEKTSSRESARCMNEPRLIDAKPFV